MIKETVFDLIETQLGLNPGTVDESMDLLDDLGADSIDLVEIIMLLERQYKIVITNDEQAESRKILAILKLIESKTQ